MTDTTKMIQWFESKIPENKIIPEDPVQAFFAFYWRIGQMNGGGELLCIIAGIILKERILPQDI